MGEQLASQFVTYDEAGRLLNATATSIRTWWREGHLSDPVVVGRRLYLWSRSEVMAIKAKRDASRV